MKIQLSVRTPLYVAFALLVGGAVLSAVCGIVYGLAYPSWAERVNSALFLAAVISAAIGVVLLFRRKL